MHDLRLFFEGLVFLLARLFVLFVLAAWAVETWLPIGTTERSLLRVLFSPFVAFYSSLTGKFPQFESPRKASREAGGGGKPYPFRTIRDAKDYLAGRIAAEAEQNGTPLTEIERKMLYFSETGWTLPEMKQVSAEFDENYDQNEYEKKIGALVARIQARDEAEEGSDLDAWDSAIVKLSRGDHYLSVLAGETPVSGKRHPQWRRILVVLLLLAYLAFWQWSMDWLRVH